MSSQKPFNKFIFIFVFAASVFFLTMLWSGSSRYSRRSRSNKKVSSEYCFYNLRSNLKSISQLIYISLTDSDSITSAPQKLTDFADDWQLTSPAEVFGREKSGGLAHYYYNPAACEIILSENSNENSNDYPSSKAPLVIYPFCDIRNYSSLRWSVLFADGHVEYVNSSTEMHRHLQNLKSEGVE